MPEVSLTPELQKFIARYVESVEKLEVLLLLANAPEKNWSPAEVHQQIQSNLKSIERRLKDLGTEGFVAQSPNGFRYQPKSPELAKHVADLGELYQKRRVTVIQAIFSESTEQLRRFSDAFRLRKDEP